MALVKRVTRIGNSGGLILDQPVLKQAGLEIGSEVDIAVEQGRIVLTPRYASDDEVDAASERVMGRRKALLTRLAAGAGAESGKRSKRRIA